MIKPAQVDNRQSSEPILTPDQAAKLCDRNFGIGGDGVRWEVAAARDIQHVLREQHITANTTAANNNPIVQRCCCLSVFLGRKGRTCISKALHSSLLSLNPIPPPRPPAASAASCLSSIMQVIFALPAVGETDFTMRIYNSDGSEPEMCGNGIRCLARFVADVDGQTSGKYKIHTLAGRV